ncbi:MAG TPA: MBL fold metallo-hydrolase [Burkholderiales bacterium]|nr:MBL fold metallo-hydrolase [Burkholderiales bacterium]
MSGSQKIVPGEHVRLNDSVGRITAPNPGMMTGPGTNAYIVGRSELAVIDPGPESAAHCDALLRAVQGRLRWILCTHTHLDHSPGARALKAATGAAVLGFGRVPDDGRQDTAFAPDRALRDGDVLDAGEFRLRAVHTPGHASNHLCYLWEERKLLFTGDHVMQGSTVVISPPDGDMTVYLRSLERLLALDLAALAPGHGHVIDTPHDEVRRLIAHRLKREQKVLDALAAKNPATLDELLPLVYDDVPQQVHPVARRSLHAHLLKLQSDGRVAGQNGGWHRGG